jgi:hypothetical protein
MAELENILGSTFGDEAIKRLNRNTILINQEVGELKEETITIDSKIQSHNVATDAHGDIRGFITQQAGKIDILTTGLEDGNARDLRYRGQTPADLSTAPTQIGTYLTPNTGTIGLPTGWTDVGRNTIAALSVGNFAQYDLQLIAGFQNKKLGYRIGNDTWRELARGNITFFSSLTEINPSFTVSTPIADIFSAMPNNSALTTIIWQGSSMVYPVIDGELFITRESINRGTVRYVTASKTFERALIGVWTNWREVATTETVELNSSYLRNGWAIQIGQLLASRNGNQVTFSGLLISGATSQNTIMVEGLPTVLRPSNTRYISLATGQSPTYQMGMLIVRSDGTITIDSGINNSRVIFNFSYPI